jgi:hypothetical protein
MCPGPPADPGGGVVIGYGREECSDMLSVCWTHYMAINKAIIIMWCYYMRGSLGGIPHPTNPASRGVAIYG